MNILKKSKFVESLERRYSRWFRCGRIISFEWNCNSHSFKPKDFVDRSHWDEYSDCWHYHFVVNCIARKWKEKSLFYRCQKPWISKIIKFPSRQIILSQELVLENFEILPIVFVPMFSWPFYIFQIHDTNQNKLSGSRAICLEQHNAEYQQ